MMKYPIGIQSFPDIRERGFVYVDKTAFVYRMALMGKFYFLSRPRRFGKSLLVSTMEAYFLGRKDLFKGLAIEQLETEWKTYPVLHLDLNAQNYVDGKALREELDKHLVIWEQTYGMAIDKSLSPETRFYNVIRTAYEQTGSQVVVLVDEYDKPLLATIDNKSLHEAYRNTLKAFFSVLKSLDACIRFVFLTGVSKFSHVSIFSDLNNLTDISMHPKYVDICGISEQELHDYFDDSIRELADANGVTYEEACERLRKQYDGYHFRENSVGIYNPFSLLNTFDNLVFNDYWFATGTPTFLVKLLQQYDYELHDLKGIYVDGDTLSSVDEEYNDPIPVLFQSGYLTISGYDSELGYRLDFPNQEVERGFFRFLMPYYTSQQQGKGFSEHPLPDFHPAWLQRAGGTSNQPRPHRHHHSDERLHLYYRAEVRQDRRGSSLSNQGEPLCPSLPVGQAQALPDRRELLFADEDGREVGGGRAVIAEFRIVLDTNCLIQSII